VDVLNEADIVQQVPLRERGEDVRTLLEHFIGELGPMVTGRPAAGLAPEAREKLLAYSWPGNVRELRNVIERALILAQGHLIQPEHLPTLNDTPQITKPMLVVDSEFPPQGVDLQAAERELVGGALRRAGHNKSKAARLLGLTRAKLYTRMERFGLS
jgi:DNA-binding NtrC family response regulator